MTSASSSSSWSATPAICVVCQDSLDSSLQATLKISESDRTRYIVWQNGKIEFPEFRHGSKHDFDVIKKSNYPAPGGYFKLRGVPGGEQLKFVTVSKEEKTFLQTSDGAYVRLDASTQKVIASSSNRCEGDEIEVDIYPLEKQVLRCGHTFHKRCIHEMDIHGCVGRCPLCNDTSDLSRIFRGHSIFDEATQLYIRSLSRPEERPELLDRAASLFREFLAVDPDHVEALCNLGNTLRQQKDFDGAIEQYRNALRIRPKHPDSLKNLGDLLKRCGDLEGAIEMYEQLLHLVAGLPIQFQIRSNLGVCYLDKGDIDDAVANFTYVLEAYPRHVPTHCYLGMAQKKMGDLDAAIHQYLQAREIDPRDPDVHYCLGNALREKGCVDEAIDEYTAALNNDPSHERARNNFNIIMREQRQALAHAAPSA